MLHRLKHMHAVFVHAHKRHKFSIENMSQEAFSKATAGNWIVSDSQKHYNTGAGTVTASRLQRFTLLSDL